MIPKPIAVRVLVLCVAAQTHWALAGPPTFQDLMNPESFPEPQYGMALEQAEVTETGLTIVTTGAEFSLDASGRGAFRQRIGHEREVAQIRIEGITATPRLTYTGKGFAFASFDAPTMDLRANGDSLFMFHAHEAVTIEFTRAIEVGFTAQYKGNCLILDERGGFGLFCSDPGFGEALHLYGEVVARYTLPADAVLWIGVCPPKPYDWERSIKDHVVWHWSMETGYPPTEELIAWAQEGNTVLLQSEVMLWKDWNLAFEPRLGEAEFARVRNDIHGQGSRFVVYTSPYYFLKDTPLESKAMNSFEHFQETGFPPGWPHGDNFDLFIAEIEEVMTNYKPDGLYFDGQYTENVPALYALARRSRQVVGEDGILEWHSTTALGDGLCFLPQADAYVDFVLRGEGRDGKYSSDDYLRYFVSCYNTSNSIGVLCNNGPKPTAEIIDRLLSVNGRMHTIVSWLKDPATMDTVRNCYRARLTPALREEVMRRSEERQGRVGERAKARAEELRQLSSPPAWNEPMLAERGEGLLKWVPSISPANESPFSLQDASLAITGRAHTHAFLTHPLDASPEGIVARLKQGTDGGMSWGPGIYLRWKNGAGLRVGLRSDGLLQVDLNGAQRLVGHHNPGEWIWVRARWLQNNVVVESSVNGTDFEPLATYEHGGACLGVAESVSVGKIPYNGAGVDHTEPGGAGTCFVDQIVIY